MMLSHPADWTTRVGWFEKQTPKEGREAIKSALTELEAAGYCKREEKKISGQFSTYDWDWTDEPFNFSDSDYSTDDGEPATGNRQRSTDDGEPATTKEKESKKKEQNQPPPSGGGTPPQKVNAITPKQLKDLWETTCPSFGKISEITAARLKSAKARGTLQRLAEVFAMVEASDLLTGRSPTKEYPNWKASLDWVLNPNNFVKIAEGNYTNKPTTNSHRSDSANAPGRYD